MPSSCSSATTLLLVLLTLNLSTFALCGTIVSHLPGFDGPLPFRLETSYVSVDEENGTELFYYFVESERNPDEDPVILWLAGGKGCTGLYRLSLDVGPLKFKKVEYDGSLPQLEYAPYSWTKVSNMIFLDQAAGSGFSFAKLPGAYEVGDIVVSKELHTFLRKWFTDHPQFLDNPLYIAGISYGGKLAPILVKEIADGNEAGQKPYLNVQGYLIGNPGTGVDHFDFASRVTYAYKMEIISYELYQSTKRSCRGNFGISTNAECAANLQVVDKFFSEINMEHILEPYCPSVTANATDVLPIKRSLREMGIELLGPPVQPPIYCRTYPRYLMYFWANSEEVQEALNIPKQYLKEWKNCCGSWSMDIPSSIDFHKNVTIRGYRALVFSGDHDLFGPILGTQEWIKSLNFPVTDKWRSWKVDGQVAGYTTLYANNLTFASIKGAGHTAPEYRPRESLAMFERWISRMPL